MSPVVPLQTVLATLSPLPTVVPWLHGVELLGFAAWAGPVLCWLTVVPRATRPAGVPAGRIHLVGGVVLVATAALATIAAVVRHDGLLGAAGLVRAALLLGSAGLLADLLRTPVGRVRRCLGLGLVGAVAVTLVLPTAVVRRPDWVLATWAAGVSAIGLAGWVGVLLTVALGRPRGFRLRRLRLVGVLSAVVAALGVGAAVAAAPVRSGAAQTVAELALGGLVVALGCGLAGLRHRPDRPRPGSRRWLGVGLAITAGVLLLAGWPA